MENTSAMTNHDLQTRWFRPVNRLGRFTTIVAMFLSFVPFLYLAVRYGVMPPITAVGVAFVNLASAYVAGWVIEPISYFPALGTAGTYMGVLAGSIGQMRVPASLVAKSVAGVEENTQEAEIVGTCGIAGSVFLNCIVTTLTAIAGSIIVSVLPEVVLSAMSAYILPAIYGAVLAMFTARSKLRLMLPILAIVILLNLMVGWGWIVSPVSKFIMFFAVAIGVIIARLEYKTGFYSK